MNQRALLIAGALFLVIVVGMFAYAYLKSNDMQRADLPEQQNEEDTASVSRINAKHFYSDGTHTIVGEVMMPTPCDLLEADAVVRESMPEQVTIELSVINNSDVCAQVVTAQRFRVDFEASEDASIDATLRGESVILNLLPPDEGETPEDFELFIKG